MLSFVKKSRTFLITGLFPGIDPTGNDNVGKDTKTYQSFLERKPSDETGWDRLKAMFQLDEFDSISSELNSIYQAGFLSFLIGALYGGFIESRAGYMNFMENNQATAFKSHLDAKRKIQDQFTLNFARGGLRWGWRIGFFTTSYYGIVTCTSVYREKSSIYEYLAAGCITGGLYKISMGPRGIAAGAIIGTALGAVAGAASLLVMKASGTTMEEVRYWQHKWRIDRDDNVLKAMKMQTEDILSTPEIIKAHDERIERKIELDSDK